MRLKRIVARFVVGFTIMIFLAISGCKTNDDFKQTKELQQLTDCTQCAALECGSCRSNSFCVDKCGCSQCAEHADPERSNSDSPVSPPPTPPPSAPSPPQPSEPINISGSILDLPRIPWEGGSAYYAQFSAANAAGWDDPTFFPISVFLGQMQSAAYYKSLGINTYQAIEHNANIWPLSSVTETGMFVLPQQGEWTPAEVGNNPNAVGWFISDECEMGLGCDHDADGDGDTDQYDSLKIQQGWVNTVRGYNDGRFTYANFGNGILRTFWSDSTMDQHIKLMDASGADKYTYTSPHIEQIIDGWHDAPDWPNGVPVARAYSYGWQADQMRRFQEPAKLRPVWTFIEFARPYLEEDDARTIKPEQIEGAVWSAIIHEARGISYFMHNNDYSCLQGTACWQANEDRARTVNARVKSLAPVLNTQSYYNTMRTVNGFTFYEYSFNNQADTMLKTYGGNAYIFAALGMRCNTQTCTTGYAHPTGTKAFTLPEGIHGTSVEVVGEGRTLPVTNGSFTDTFAAEYTHHVYKIALENQAS